MSFAHRLRLPISTRHAFALAFDLAARRDPAHSLLTPFLVRAPWVLALLLLPSLGDSMQQRRVLLLWSIATIGSFLTWIAVDAMLRFRARSVFNTPAGTRPAPVLECYALGLRRLPWLYLTEFLRGTALTFAFSIFVLPFIFLGHRLSFSTEAVVLDDHNLTSAFRHSFKISAGRFERWFEMIVVSVLLVLSVLFVAAALAVGIPTVSWSVWRVVGPMLVVAIWPIIQYAWTFFYLRLVEVEDPKGIEVGPLYAGKVDAPAEAWRSAPDPAPRLTLVESGRADEDKTG